MSRRRNAIYPFANIFSIDSTVIYEGRMILHNMFSKSAEEKKVVGGFISFGREIIILRSERSSFSRLVMFYLSRNLRSVLLSKWFLEEVGCDF